MGKKITRVGPGSRRVSRRGAGFGVYCFCGGVQQSPRTLFASALSAMVRLAFWIDGDQHRDAGNGLLVHLGRGPRAWSVYRTGSSEQRFVSPAIPALRRSTVYDPRGPRRRPETGRTGRKRK